MKLLMRYLKSKWKIITLYLICTAIFFISFRFYRLPLNAVLYPCVLCFICCVFYLITDFFAVRRRHRRLTGLRQRSLGLIETLAQTHDIEQEDYERLVDDIQRQVREMQAENDRKYHDMVDYYTVWAHQIKTPIASMKLALQNEDSGLARQLSADLFRTCQYVDMVLAFLRLDSDSTDYIFREYELDGIVRSCVRKFAPEFIGRKLSLDLAPLPQRIVTDEKWLSFVIEQILSNALKYTKKGTIRIYAEGETLVIADSGIGIATDDLPRVFEKGYTGYNGRSDKSASGLGLYLCRRVCDRLGIELSIRSVVNEGTAVSLDLSQKKTKAE